MISVMTKPVFGDGDLCLVLFRMNPAVKFEIKLALRCRHYVTDIIMSSEGRLN